MKLKKKQQITAFEVCLYLFFGVLALLTLYPFYNVLIVSFSNTVTSVKYSPYLFPHVFDLTGYKAIIKDVYFFKSLGTTLLVTVLGTTLNMVFSVVAAYVLSRKRLIGRKVFLSAILFTMLFSGGLIPTYLVICDLQLDNTIWSMILPTMISTYYLIIMKNYFASLPPSLEEAARIDGANEFSSFLRIGLPLLKPTLVTVGITVVVAMYNDYIWPTIALTGGDDMKTFCQIVFNAASGIARTDLGLVAASFILGTIPLMLITCSCLKYYLEGMVAGAVKG